MTEQPTPSEFESVLVDYPVRLQNFEGPLDLLLHLIKTHEVSIYDIPIVLVTRQYLDYLDLMQEMNLDIAGEFLVMAATLIHVKSRMLLPRVDPTQEDPEEDPRESLIRRLLEHQKFKAAAELLHEREIQRSAQWLRPDGRLADVVGETPGRVEVDLFSLTAFSVLDRARQRRACSSLPNRSQSRIASTNYWQRLSESDACGFSLLRRPVGAAGGDIPRVARNDSPQTRPRLPTGSFGPIRCKRAKVEGAPDALDETPAAAGRASLRAGAAHARGGGDADGQRLRPPRAARSEPGAAARAGGAPRAANIDDTPSHV
jgi:segregation and condensation protein A